MFSPVHSLCAWSKNPRNPLLPLQALLFVGPFFAIHSCILPSPQFKGLLGVIFSLSSFQTLKDLLQLANKLCLLNISPFPPRCPPTYCYGEKYANNFENQVSQQMSIQKYNKLTHNVIWVPRPSIILMRLRYEKRDASSLVDGNDK